MRDTFHEGGDWSDYWQRMANLRWGALDQHVLEVVGDAIGWWPTASLCELGGGRGVHSLKLKAAGRCGKTTIVDPCPEARLLAGRLSHRVLATQPDEQFDIVWSSGLIEHFSGPARQAIIDEHFRLARELVVIVVPVATWTRRLSPPSTDTPWCRLYTRDELGLAMVVAAAREWSVVHPDLRAFAPLYGIRHIADAFYPTLTRLVRPFLRGGLLVGTARKRGTLP